MFILDVRLRLRRMSGDHGCESYGIKGVGLAPQNKVPFLMTSVN